MLVRKELPYLGRDKISSGLWSPLRWVRLEIRWRKLFEYNRKHPAVHNPHSSVLFHHKIFSSEAERHIVETMPLKLRLELRLESLLGQKVI